MSQIRHPDFSRKISLSDVERELARWFRSERGARAHHHGGDVVAVLRCDACDGCAGVRLNLTDRARHLWLRLTQL
jgi:hypothetical protein